MPTNYEGQSDIVTHKTNTWNKEYIYYAKWIFHHINAKLYSENGRVYNLLLVKAK